MKLKVFIIMVLVFVIGAFFYFLPKLIVINSIECKSQYGPCDVNISEQLDQLGGNEYGGAKAEIINILGNNLLIEDYTYQFKLPDKILINVLQRKTQFALKREGDENLFLVDKAGFIVDAGTFSNLPTLEIEGNIPNVGEKISDDVSFTLGVFSDLYRLYQLDVGRMYPNYSEFTLPGGYKVIFPTEGDGEILIGSMLVILNQLNSEEQNSRIDIVKDMKIIDLRYKNPVIK
ncbi:hypothetical protein ACFL0F_02380 [Patescibacteria group bacterium]